MNIKQILALLIVGIIIIFAVLAFTHSSSPAMPNNSNNSQTKDSQLLPGNFSLNGTIRDMSGTVLTLELSDKTFKDVAYTGATEMLKQNQTKAGLTFTATTRNSLKIGSQIVVYTTMNPKSKLTLLVDKIIITK